MTVTFAPADNTTVDTRVFRLTCDTGAALGEWVGYANAYGEAQAHSLVCTESLCQGYGADVEEIFAEGAPVPVHVNQRNAMDLLAVLGYQVLTGDEYPDLYGQAPAADFLDRVELALALAPVDQGLVTIAIGNTIDCGRRPGYLQERLTQLRTLALACQAADLEVTWG